MKNKILILIISILLIIPINVFAASGSYTISSSSSIEQGQTISVTFKINASKLFYWQACITYDTSKLELISGSKTFQGEADALSGQSSASKTLKFKAKNKGSAWVTIAMGDKGNNINANSEEISYSKKTKTITIKEKTVKKYSSNNYLKTLEIDGYKISPTFNKNTLEYKVELPTNTQEIKINATKEDSTSTISGIGNQKVSEGINKLKIKVTAENGNTREYIINATVKELEPIEVTLNNEKYTVIRKQDQLPQVNSTYITSTIKINNEEVPVLTSEITKYTLVTLKDSKGNIELYKYENSNYTLYKEIIFNKLTINPIEDENIIIPKGYKETKITINGEEIAGYIKDSYPIFKGLNIETGEKGLYSYDKDEETVQKFKTKSNINLNNDKDMNEYIIIGLGSILIFTYLGILINLIKRKNKNVNTKKENKNNSNNKDD